MKVLQNRWFILCAFLVPLNIIYGFDRNALALVSLPVRIELGIDYVLMSQIIVASTAVYAFMQIPAGWLANRVGVRWAMAGACILWSAATFLTSVQTGVTGFFAARILLGICQAPDWVTCILAIKILFPEAEREKANSFILAALNIGFVLCGTLTPWIAQHSGWRYCFSLYGAIGLIFGFIVLFFYRGTDHEVIANVVNRVELGFSTNKNVWKIGQVSIYYFFICILFGFFATTFPRFANSYYGISPASAGQCFSILWAVLYLSVISWGSLIKHLKQRGRGSLICGVLGRTCSLILASGFLAAGIVADNLAACMVLMAFAMASIALSQVLLWTRVQVIPGATGVAAGFVMFAGNAALAITPVSFELIYKHYASWMPLSVVCIVAGLLGASLWLKADPIAPTA